MLSELVNPKTTAILVIDLQNAFCSAKEPLPKAFQYDTSPIDAMIPKLERFIAKSRESRVNVVWIRRIENSRDVPENLRIKMKAEGWLDNISTPGKSSFEYYKIKPQNGEIEFVKTLYDAFTNPDLQKHLENCGIKTLILTGVYTSRCIDSTMISGFNLGYNVIIPEDLVAMPVISAAYPNRFNMYRIRTANLKNASLNIGRE